MDIIIFKALLKSETRVCWCGHSELCLKVKRGCVDVCLKVKRECVDVCLKVKRGCVGVALFKALLKGKARVC